MAKYFIHTTKQDEFFYTICGILQSLSQTITYDEKEIPTTDGTVVLGGDGSVLGAARLGVKSPILVINTGHLGFLTSSGKADYHRAIVQFITKRFTTTTRYTLAISQDNQPTVTALNDIVIRKAILSGLVEMSIYASKNGQKEELVSDYRADGLIVSTPTGSTAYNLSAMGPIIHPDSPVMVITPICPQGLTQRPLVIPSTYSLRIVAHTEGMGMSIDGQLEFPVGTNVVIHFNDHAVNTVDPIISYFQVLREKLGWGIRPVSGVTGA